MAKGSPTPATESKVPASPEVDDFENPEVGEIFGGSYPQLVLEANQVSPLLEYVKDTKIQLESQNKPGEFEMRSVPVVKNSADGKLYTVSISAIFTKHWKEANVNMGDTLKIKRYPDATKKRGAGAGKPMQVHALKVYARAKAE